MQVIDIKVSEIFKKHISDNFLDSLSDFHISTLSNMLAMHYKLMDLPQDIYDFLDLVSNRLKKFINGKVILDNDFSTTLGLFTISIQDTDNNGLEEKSLKNEIENLMVNLTYSDCDDNEKNIIRDLIKKVLSSEKTADSVNYMFFCSFEVKQMIDDHIKRKIDINKLFDNLQKYASNFNILRSQQEIKLSLSNIISSAVGVSILVGGVALTGILAPILIIPATIFGINIGNKVSNFISHNLYSNENTDFGNLDKNRPTNSIKPSREKILEPEAKEISKILKANMFIDLGNVTQSKTDKITKKNKITNNERIF